MKQLLKLIKDDYRGVIKRTILLSTLGITSLGYTLLNNYRGKAYEIPMGLDFVIPFNKYFIVPYIYWYAFIIFFLTYYILFDEKMYFKLLMGINFGMMVSFVVFYFFPTTVPRPVLTGDDVFTRAVMMIYGNDNPYNCFPSIHVLDSVLVAIYVTGDSRFSRRIKVLVNLLSFSIILSTLFVKQHYVYDAIGGIAVAYLMYAAFNYKLVAEKLSNLRERIKTPGIRPGETKEEQVL